MSHTAITKHHLTLATAVQRDPFARSICDHCVLYLCRNISLYFTANFIDCIRGQSLQYS